MRRTNKPVQKHAYEAPDIPMVKITPGKMLDVVMAAFTFPILLAGWLAMEILYVCGVLRD